MRTAVAAIADVLRGDLVAVIEHGSRVTSGPRPTSDVDLLVVVSRPLAEVSRRALAARLLDLSGAPGSSSPPLDVAVVVRSRLWPWRFPPWCEFQFGEWLRDELVRGRMRPPAPDPDLTIGLVVARDRGRSLVGPAPDELLPPVPAGDVREAIAASVPTVLAEFAGDERNVVLTLARMVVTVETGAIVAKDEAADRVRSTVDGPTARALLWARDDYRGAHPPPVPAAELHRAAEALAGRLPR
ncbi:aminoglycoside adenylyltransferase domain-containing protein [Saccharomonospora saliphila]|uniref:aminoglycoside adenylyltransferase domain-containing protein n=1 Tax=Saccharomonospora saliphila TaxID=369829 RepID=UPI00036DC9ED|nr:aminoglycoside adenylyltransferase domain-containing protein [Saccharomonospora saliphila]